MNLLSLIGFNKMSIIEKIRRNPPKSVVDMEEHEMYWSILNDISGNGVQLQYHDRHSLGELAVSICEMNRLRHELKTNGEAMEVQGDRNKVTKKNPARDALEKLRPAILRLMKEFQMTPSSRGKTFGPQSGGGKDDDGFDSV
jgi:hypothetical protein